MNTVLVGEDDVQVVANQLSQGGCVAFPTETVFGLGVKYSSKEALDQLYQLKQRNLSKAMTLMIAQKSDIKKYAYINNIAQKLIDAFMPGKITLIFEKKETIKDEYTSSLDTIGIRIPDNDFVLKLIEKTGPLFVTSANISGHENCLDDQEVLKIFQGKIPLIVKGRCESSIASTVVDVSKGKALIIRQGEITEKMIKEVLE